MFSYIVFISVADSGQRSTIPLHSVHKNGRLSGCKRLRPSTIFRIRHCFIIITARIRRMREGNIFSLFTLVGRGVPCPRSGWGGGNPRSEWGGTQSQVWMGWGQYPIPGPDGGYPILLTGEYPHPRSGQVYCIQDWMGYPLPHPHPPPPSEDRSALLHGGRYASCVHAGGLSCSKQFLPFGYLKWNTES